MKIPKIGKRGWLGVILFVTGWITVLSATSMAQTEMKQSPGDVFEKSYAEAMAHGAGYNSFSDALADHNRGSGKFFICVGSVLIWWGHRRYNGIKPDGDKTPDAQNNKPPA